MKVCMFHLMPYRDLPPDFGERYKSAYIDPLWFDVADPKRVSQYYNWTLDEFVYAARSWEQPWRVVLKAEVMSAGDTPRFVVTSLEAPTPQMLYEDLY